MNLYIDGHNIREIDSVEAARIWCLEQGIGTRGLTVYNDRVMVYYGAKDLAAIRGR